MEIILNNERIDLLSEKLKAVSLVTNREADTESLKMLHRAYIAREAFSQLEGDYSDGELSRIMNLQYALWMKYDPAEPVIYDALVELLNSRYTLKELEKMKLYDLFDLVCRAIDS